MGGTPPPFVENSAKIINLILEPFPNQITLFDHDVKPKCICVFCAAAHFLYPLVMMLACYTIKMKCSMIREGAESSSLSWLMFMERRFLPQNSFINKNIIYFYLADFTKALRTVTCIYLIFFFL